MCGSGCGVVGGVGAGGGTGGASGGGSSKRGRGRGRGVVGGVESEGFGARAWQLQVKEGLDLWDGKLFNHLRDGFAAVLHEEFVAKEVGGDDEAVHVRWVERCRCCGRVRLCGRWNGVDDVTGWLRERLCGRGNGAGGVTR